MSPIRQDPPLARSRALRRAAAVREASPEGEGLMFEHLGKALLLLLALRLHPSSGRL